MARLLLALCLLLPALAGRADPAPSLPVKLREVPAPNATDRSAALATAPDGTVWLAWIEPTSGGNALRCATLDAAAAEWSAPRTITQDANFAAGQPAFTVASDGRLTAAWTIQTGPADQTSLRFSQSTDRGRTWSPPAPLARGGPSSASVSLQALADDRVLAAWRDGSGDSSLFTRCLGDVQADRRVESAGHGEGSAGLAAFPNGTALLAGFSRATDGTGGLRVMRFEGNQWSAGPSLLPGEAQPAGEGPRLASAGGRAGIAWCVTMGGEARVQAAVSPDAGNRFLSPLRVDLGRPRGGVDVIMLADGTLLVTWLEGGAQPGLWLRRITPASELGGAVRLAALDPSPLAAVPRMTLVHDYEASPAQLAVVFGDNGSPAKLRTLLVTLPDRSTLAGRAPCVPCDEEDAAAVRGYPIKGRIIEVRPERAVLLVRHEEIPGVMRAMTMEFHASPDILAEARPGRELLARIERRGSPWWIFGVRWLGAPTR